MRVIVVEPQKVPYIKDIENNLTALQREVNGYIQIIYPFLDPVAIVCNDDGKIIGLPYNRVLRDKDGHIFDVIAGTFLIVGIEGEDLADVPQPLIAQYMRMFEYIEQFEIDKYGRIIVRRNSNDKNR